METQKSNFSSFQSVTLHCFAKKLLAESAPAGDNLSPQKHLTGYIIIRMASKNGDYRIILVMVIMMMYHDFRHYQNQHSYYLFDKYTVHTGYPPVI